MDKRISVKKAIEQVKTGDTLMVGGFLESGHPELLMKELLTNSDVSELTIISNDTGTNNLSCYELIVSGRVKKIYASYIGANKATGNMLTDNEEAVTLVPQGTLAEQIRAGGAGIGGFLTKVGLGTVVEKNKTIINCDGEDYLLEKPLKADVAFVWANKADRFGNLKIEGSTKNFNAIMPAAAKITIAQVEELCESLSPEEITVAGIYVDYIVCGCDNR